MSDYCKQLEDLINETLLPTYIEHYRLLGKENPILELNSKITYIMKNKKKIPILLQRQKYGR